jgi:hypothetical protein
MTGFADFDVLVAFTTPYSSGSASWDDLTSRCASFSCNYGRTDADEVCGPGSGSAMFDNTDGELDPDNTSSAFYGYIRPNRRTRFQVTFGSNLYYLHSGYADSWTRTWPGGAILSGTALASTDRMKFLAKRTNTGSTVQEQADDRLVAILENGGVDVIVPSGSRSINADGYNCRTLVAHPYDGTDTLSNCQDVARADGGAFYVDGQGKVIFQSTRYRTDNARSTTSQATFGNTGSAGVIEVEDDIDPTVDDTIMTNRVLVTDGENPAVTHVAEDTTAQGEDGVLELDLGNTLLRGLDAPDRAADVLLLRKDPRPRYDSITVDMLTQDATTQELLCGLQISDRVTLAIDPLGGGTAMSRDQYVEGIAHAVDFQNPSWKLTLNLSGAYGGSRVLP